ncbi:uncharacterized protein LOC142138738 isoform X2 [Mixophyes fleayi]
MIMSGPPQKKIPIYGTHSVIVIATAKPHPLSTQLHMSQASGMGETRPLGAHLQPPLGLVGNYDTPNLPSQHGRAQPTASESLNANVKDANMPSVSVPHSHGIIGEETQHTQTTGELTQSVGNVEQLTSSQATLGTSNKPTGYVAVSEITLNVSHTTHHDSPPVVTTSNESSDAEQGPKKLIKCLQTQLLGKPTSKTSLVLGPQVGDRAGDMGQCESQAITFGVRPDVKDKIKRGTFIDMFTITETVKRSLDDACSKNGIGEHKYCSFPIWLKWYCIFAPIYMQYRPSENTDIWRYLYMINYMFVKDSGYIWRADDDIFRHKISGRSSIPLGHKDIDTWMELMRPSSQANLLPGQRRFQSGGRATAPPPQRNRCYAFNSGSCSRGTGCKYRHVCSTCRGSHPATECTRPNHSAGRGRAGQTAASQNKAPTPINVTALDRCLRLLTDKEADAFLRNDFRYGFSIQVQGALRLPIPRNLKSAYIFPKAIADKITKEISLGRMIGPFKHPPQQFGSIPNRGCSQKGSR